MATTEHDQADRADVPARDLKAALKAILLAPRGKVRSENREPTREELQRRYRLERRG